MRTIELGKTGMHVVPVGYGCMGLTHAYGTALPLKDAADRVRAAVDLGYNFIDTAECYHGHYADGSVALNEDAVGRGLEGIRDKVILASKCGVLHLGDHLEMDSRPETIRKSVEGTLTRLKTDHLDLYYQHRIDPKVEPEIVAETMGELIREGKIRAWGISAVNEEYLRRAHAVTPVSAVQNLYSMIDRDTEKLFGTLEELGITVVAYSPLAKGFLSGKFMERPSFSGEDDNRGARYQFSEEGFQAYQTVLDLIRSLGEEYHAAMSQISLAWILSRKPYISAIPGSRSLEHMKENLLAADLVLSQDETARIDAALNALALADSESKRLGFR